MLSEPIRRLYRSRVTPQALEDRLLVVQVRLQPPERFLHQFAQHLNPPIFYQSTGTHRGFRYGQADARHFCLLKGVRALGGMNACIHLARAGYTQEIAVILRTIVECTSLIDWVKLAADPSGAVRSDPQLTYVKTYFDDYKRDQVGQSLKLGVRQGDIHRDVGAWLDEGAEKVGAEMSSGARLLSSIYQTNSSYVHARYPETMDLYGGRPGSFHVRGMLGTPKDDENTQVIETYATSIAQTVAGVALHFNPPFFEVDAQFQAWISTL